MSRRDKPWWLEEDEVGYEIVGVEERGKGEGLGGGGVDYEGILRGGVRPRRLEQRIQVTSISRVVKFYAVTGGLLGGALLASGEYLWAAAVIASIVVIYVLGR